MNYNTQNAKIASITEKTLIVGIDVVTIHGTGEAEKCFILIQRPQTDQNPLCVNRRKLYFYNQSYPRLKSRFRHKTCRLWITFDARLLLSVFTRIFGMFYLECSPLQLP